MNAQKKIVFAIGRWMPIHLGHKNFLVKLAREYDRLIIGIGSCYENGTPRNCIPAAEREKLLRKVLETEGIPASRVRIVPIRDRETFEEWIDDVVRVCRKYHVTHFCTGNKEDILSVLDEKGIDLNMEMIDPEADSAFPFHATEIRAVIAAGQYDKLRNMLPEEICGAVVKQVSKEIVAANEGRGKAFIPGRQTVDMVFLLRDPSNGTDYVLLGNRSAGKKDFPGALAIPGGKINEFESPVNAALRVFRLETGIQIKLVNNADEPADIRLPQLGNRPEKLWFTGIYASPDTRVNGTRGGGSQCFAVYTEAKREEVEPLLFSRHDMENLRFVPVREIPGLDLAFQQKDMVTDTFRRLDIDYLKAEYLAVYTPEGRPTGEKVLRKAAHETGVWHAASHIYVCRKNAAGETEILLQRRSHSKDTYPDKLDTSSAGHVEAGMGFPDTAVKELGEELGLTVSPEELAFAFDRTVDHTWNEHGKILTDREYNRVYLLWCDVPAQNLRLQKEEVSEAVWLTAKEIEERVKAGDEEICTDKGEVEELMEYLKKMNDEQLKMKNEK